MRQGFRRTSVVALTFLFSLCSFCVPARPADTGRPLLHRVDPVYPALAHQMRLAGSVTLVLSIEPNGTVSDARVQSGHPLLMKAAIDAVRQWKFAAAPSATEQTVRVSFGFL